MEEKSLIMLKDLESQRSYKQHRFLRFLRSDLFLILSLITSILLLCFLLTSNVYYTRSQFKALSKSISQNPSIAVTNENTIDKSKMDPDKELMKDLIRQKETSSSPQQQIDLPLDSNYDINQEYKTIVGLSPVIIISWDDDQINIPVTQSNPESALGTELSAETTNPESDYEISKNLKTILTKNYQILPQPAILSINKHPNRIALINNILKKVENLGISKKSNFLPGLIVNGRPVASAKAIESLHANGKLIEYLKSWGADTITVEKL